MRKLLPVFFMALFLNSNAQNNPNQCLTDQFKEKYLQEHPEQRAERELMLKQVEQLKESNKTLGKKGAVRVIPVVFHIIHTYGPENISRQKILDQLKRLNEDFRRLNPDTSNTRALFKSSATDCEIEFRLANIDPAGNCTDGIVRVYSPLHYQGNEQVKSLSRWDNKKYLNVWVISEIKDTDGDPNTTTLGYAYLPWSTNPSIDGIVIRADRVNYSDGRTLTHEVGHYLGLEHTFADGCVTSNCSSTGDGCCDTPPVASPSFGCNYNLVNCVGNTVQIENYMDYANSSCMNMFTINQKAIIDYFMINNQYRKTLWTNANLVATGTDDNNMNVCTPKADFYTNYTSVCAGFSVSFFDATWRSDSYTRSWTFEGGTPSSSSAQNPVISYTTPGIYKVVLKVVNGSGSDSIVRTEYIDIKPAAGQKMAPIAMTFEGLSFGDSGWTIENGTYQWELSSAAFTGTQSIKADVPAGEIVSFRSPGINLSVFPNGTYPAVFFRYAHKVAQSGTSDILKMYISQDCGATWIQRITRGGTALATVSGNGWGFIPASQSEWKIIKYDLSPYMSTSGGNKNITLRFEAISDGGNPIYIDDINVGYFALGTSEPAAPVSHLGLYPNPGATTSTLALAFDMVSAAPVSVQITDITGREVFSTNLGTLNQGAQQYLIDASLFQQSAQGVYFVRLTAGGSSFVQKLVLLGGK